MLSMWEGVLGNGKGEGGSHLGRGVEEMAAWSPLMTPKLKIRHAQTTQFTS